MLYEVITMLNAAFASERPTLFFYPKNALNDRGVTTTPDVQRHFVPLGRARVCRQGGDITLVCWGNTVRLCLQVADALATAGVAAEVIDLVITSYSIHYTKLYEPHGKMPERRRDGVPIGAGNDDRLVDAGPNQGSQTPLDGRATVDR